MRVIYINGFDTLRYIHLDLLTDILLCECASHCSADQIMVQQHRNEDWYFN
jgi:hypothetical protein